MTHALQMFARMIKIDEAKRTVTGVIANEALDRAGEIFDYDTSKPLFVDWSETVSKASGGKSVGNLRAMHGDIVAGKIDQLDFDDVAKSISVVSNVVDDNEWAKCLAGCYTGFSIGGSYAGKWDDPIAKGVKRYTGKPVEVSLVDIPCNPDAGFTVTKADGVEEMRKYAPVAERDAIALAVDEILAKRAAAVPIEAVAEVTAADRLHKRLDEAAPMLDALSSIRGEGVLEKGLYTVSRLADVLSSLSCIQSDSANEAAWEGDNSAVPAQLRSVVVDLGAALIAMAQEEVAEAVAQATPTDDAVLVVDVMELSAKAEGLQKAADTATAELVKRDEALAKANGDLLKLRTEHETLAKSFGEITKQHTALKAEHAALLVKAAPARAIATPLPVTKNADVPEGEKKVDPNEPVLKRDGSIDNEATAQKLIKAAHANPRPLHH